jgi:hypothetical protein
MIQIQTVRPLAVSALRSAAARGIELRCELDAAREIELAANSHDRDVIEDRCCRLTCLLAHATRLPSTPERLAVSRGAVCVPGWVVSRGAR